MAKKTTIRCPHCGWEYLPGEIYYPNDFVGKPWNIIRDAQGNILGYDGDDMNTAEYFQCEHCNKEFKVDASITFRTESTNNVFDDGDEFVSVLK